MGEKAEVEETATVKKSKVRKSQWWLLAGLPIWVYASFLLAQCIVGLFIRGLSYVGVSFEAINVVVVNTILSVVVYGLTLCVVIFVPLWLKKRVTTRRLLGIYDWPTMLELIVAPLAYVVYIIIAGVIMAVAVYTFTVDIKQPQALPFSQGMLITQWQLVLAFGVMVVLAPVAEELLFRGYLYGKLRNSFPAWLAIFVTSVAFGVAHLWGGEGVSLQWAVAIDTFAISLVMCLAREYTGAIWVPMMIHMIKNGIAFYLLFINPTLIQQLSAIVSFI